MSLKKYIPYYLTKHLRLIQLKNRFPSSEIHSNLVSKDVQLGKKTKIGLNVTVKKNVRLKDYSYLNDNTVVGEGVRIGKYCSIAYNCQIGLNEHPTNFLSTSPFIYGSNNILGTKSTWNDFSKQTLIGNDVWIGSNAVVLQGVEIGNGAIIASGAVVTKNVPPYAIVGGVPAKIIKYRFNENTINLLIDSEWWDLSEEEIKNNKELFKIVN